MDAMQLKDPNTARAGLVSGPSSPSCRSWASALRAVAPFRPGDVLAGRPALVTLELDPEGGTLEVTGRLAGLSRPWRWTAEIPPVEEGRIDPLPRTPLPVGALYGRERVADLELEARSDRSDPLRFLPSCLPARRTRPRRPGGAATRSHP